MRLILLILAVTFLFVPFSFSQSKIEDDIDFTLVNAKKGVYWALSNIPEKKTKAEHSLISEDKLIAKVKVSKEVNGLRIESTGYFETNELTVVLYRSSERLIKDGYLKNGSLETYSDEE
jgi:hypothetical protein